MVATITIMNTSLVFFMKIEWRLKMPFGLTRMVKCWKQMAKFRESFTFIDRKSIQLSVLTCPKPSAKTKKQQFLELRPDERDRPPLFISFDSFCPDLTHRGIQTICYSVKQQNPEWLFSLVLSLQSKLQGLDMAISEYLEETSNAHLSEYWLCTWFKAHKISTFSIFQGWLKIQMKIRKIFHL